jgi:Carbohydrate esterase, sialic acid-specific acetylesterase
MNISSPARMYIGGFYNKFQFAGDIDEVRISKVTRSANWIKMEYENQRTQQKMVGHLVQSGSNFAVTPTSLTLPESATEILSAQAGGAQRVEWIEKRNGVDTVLATGKFSLPVTASRVDANTNYIIQFKKYTTAGSSVLDVPITITEALSNPEFTLDGPSAWNGRNTITVKPIITNLNTLQNQGATNFNYSWTVNGVAVNKKITPGSLILTRAQGNGAMVVTLVMDNGGQKVTQTKTINVQQPESDAWVPRIPDQNEKPVENQFFARDKTGYGMIYYNGTELSAVNKVYLKVYKTDSGNVLYKTYTQSLVNGKYSFAAPIFAGKFTYKVEYGTIKEINGVDQEDPPSASVTNLLCGDAYLIEGQSNALATDNQAVSDSDTWIRTYGLSNGWGTATSRGVLDEMRIGVWGFIFAKRLLVDYNMPICIINGAIGGTRIDQHLPNPENHSLAGSSYSIYANLYNRIVRAKLTHGIRAVLWHQGEQDQGSGGIDSDCNYKFYQKYFIDISAAWKEDFPNILNYYVFQIWPKACGDSTKNDELREVQRTLSRNYSNMRLMSTLGIIPGSGCHYQVFSDLISPLVKQDHYAYFPNSVFSAPNLQKAYFTTAIQNEVALEFDQDIAWNTGATSFYHLSDGKTVLAGSASGKIIRLKLNSASTAKTITYLKGALWQRQQANLINGKNGIAALTFADVPISRPTTNYINWASGVAQGLTSGDNDAAVDDPDKDGITNLMEFVLGGSPVIPEQAVLPKVIKFVDSWVFEYDRSKLSVEPFTTQTVEYGSNLTGWTSVPIPTTSQNGVTITSGAIMDHVKVTIPSSAGKVFARLKVTTP